MLLVVALGLVVGIPGLALGLDALGLHVPDTTEEETERNGPHHAGHGALNAFVNRMGSHLF